MILPPIYHWSPRERRKNIERRGLLPGRPPTRGSVSSVHDGVHVLCFSTDPMMAWLLSGRDLTVERWDLWQVSLTDTDAVFIRSDYGPRIIEVRVANRIPKSRLKWVGER